MVTGSAGAATAAFCISPDFAVVVDVSMAMTPDDRPDRCAEMVKGPMIGIAPILDRRLSGLFTEICEKENIPYQFEVMGSRTGTDADFIAVSAAASDSPDLHPLRFMPTPAEVVSVSDVENTASLIAKAVGGKLCSM